MIGYWLVMGIVACALVAVAVAVANSRGGARHQRLVVPDRPDPPAELAPPRPIEPPDLSSLGEPNGDAPVWVALGATTAAFGPGNDDGATWVAMVAATLPSPVLLHDLSVPGTTLVEARRDQVPAALAHAPDLITVWFAASDLLQEIRLASHERDLDALLDACTAPGRRIVVGTVPPLPDAAVPPDQSGDDAAAVISRWNAGVARVAVAHGAVVADLHAGGPFLAPTDIVIGEFRLSPAGHRALADRFRPAVASALERIPPRSERRPGPVTGSSAGEPGA